MGLREFIIRLEQEGIRVQEYQIRYAIRANKISRPDMDPSLRFRFSEEHLEQARKTFGEQETAA